MAEEYLDLTEVCGKLQIGEDKALQLLKAGELEAEEIEGEMRFTASSVAAYMEKIADGETVMKGGTEEETLDFEEEKEETDVDLSDIESEPGADESDQTSVLKPIGDADKGEDEEEEAPEFHFEEEEEDSTSFLDKEEKPAGAAAEMESAEMESDELDTVSLSPDEIEEDESGMVADLLSADSGGDDLDDSLETVDLAELDSGTEEISDDTDTVPTDGSSAETQLVGEEADLGEEDTVGLDGVESETEDIGGTLLDLGEEEGVEEEGEAPQFAGVGPSQTRPAAAGDMVSVQPSTMGNAFLAISLLLIAFAGFMLLSAGLGLYHNPVAMWIFKNVGEMF